MSTIAVLTGVCLLMSTPAYAYVDPGAGSMLVQLVTGGVAGLLVLTRLWWTRARGKFGKSRPSSLEPSSRPEDSASLPPRAR